jgi:D-glycero-beta-D-manno-heptose 1-phosphate adenylyltransferase
MTARRASAKIGTLEEVGARVAEERHRGARVALASGGFDVLHVGHVRYLQAARARADRLVVAVRGDESVRRLEGTPRPWQPESDRALLVAALRSADHVLVFAEDDLHRVLLAVRPYFWCRAGDAPAETGPERQAVEACAAQVVVLGEVDTHDVRTLLQKLRG